MMGLLAEVTSLRSSSSQMTPGPGSSATVSTQVVKNSSFMLQNMMNAIFFLTDGSLLMCTPMDPLFIALPYFMAAAKVVGIGDIAGH